VPISLPRQRFTAWRIAGIADRVGVYVLWLGEEIIYIGRATAGMRQRLMEHYTRQAKPWDATHFGALPCDTPAQRERELLREAKRTFGRLPRYNASA